MGLAALAFSLSNSTWISNVSTLVSTTSKHFSLVVCLHHRMKAPRLHQIQHHPPHATFPTEPSWTLSIKTYSWITCGPTPPRVPQTSVGKHISELIVQLCLESDMHNVSCFVSLRVDLPTVWHGLGRWGFGEIAQITFSLYIIVSSVNFVIFCFWGVGVSHYGQLLGVPHHSARAQHNDSNPKCCLFLLPLTHRFRNHLLTLVCLVEVPFQRVLASHTSGPPHFREFCLLHPWSIHQSLCVHSKGGQKCL